VYQRAAELAFSGRTIQAEEAKELGIVMEVVEEAALSRLLKSAAPRRAQRN